MKIKVNILRKKETKDLNLDDGATVGDVLNKLSFKPDTIIVMSNNSPIPVDEVLENGQELTIIQVSSGG